MNIVKLCIILKYNIIYIYIVYKNMSLMSCPGFSFKLHVKMYLEMEPIRDSLIILIVSLQSRFRDRVGPSFTSQA